MARPGRDRKVLILGGTGEAAALAARLAAAGGWQPLTSLAGVTRRPRPVPGRRRRGGFGGAAGLARFLAAERPAAVVDATHPFASRISGHAVSAAAATGIPLLRLSRPAWAPRPGDRWLHVPDLAAAAGLLRDLPARVFLSLGAGHLEAFAGCRRPWFLVRTIDAPLRRPLPRGQVVVGRGPFTELRELALLRRHRIDLVVARNSGGRATYAKLAAARRLGLPVVMVERPPLPPAAEVQTVEAAVAWLERQLREERAAPG